MTEVRQGMLRDEDRQLIAYANKERLPVVVGTLHACIFETGQSRVKPTRCEEPYIALGTPTDWSMVNLLLLHPSARRSIKVPWLSAVRVWRPDLAPDESEIKSIIRMYSTGSVSQVHP